MCTPDTSPHVHQPTNAEVMAQLKVLGTQLDRLLRIDIRTETRLCKTMHHLKVQDTLLPPDRNSPKDPS